jgi:hypothetical protein
MEKSNIQSTQVGETTPEGEVFATSFTGFMNSGEDDNVERYEEDDDYSETNIDENQEDTNTTKENEEDATGDNKDSKGYKDDQDGDEKNEEGDLEGDDEEEGDLDEMDAYSEAAIIAKSLQQEGSLPEDFNITEDMDWYSLKEGLKSTVMNQGVSVIEQRLEEMGEAKKYVEYLMQGGNINHLAASMGNVKYTQLDISDNAENKEENRENIIRAYYMEKDLPIEDINRLIEDLQDSGSDESRALTAKVYFREKEELQLAQEHQARQQREQQQAHYIREKTQKIESYISSGRVGDFELSNAEQVELHNAIFKPTEVVESIGPDGKKVRSKVTKIALLEHQLQNSPEKQVIFAKLLINGFNVGDIKQQGAYERDDQILNQLNSRSRQRKRKTPINKGGNLTSRQVGEY